MKFTGLSLMCVASCVTAMWATVTRAADEPTPASKSQVYHVVSFKFKEDATPDQIKAVETAFAALKTKIPFVTSLHWGTNISPEKRNKGFTHCWVLTFANEKDRDAYIVHPEHAAFVKLAGPIIGDVFVVDFQSKE